MEDNHDVMSVIEAARREMRLELSEMRQEIAALHAEQAAAATAVATAVADIRREIVSVRRGGDAAVDAIADQYSVFAASLYREIRTARKDISDIWEKLSPPR